MLDLQRPLLSLDSEPPHLTQYPIVSTGRFQISPQKQSMPRRKQWTYYMVEKQSTASNLRLSLPLNAAILATTESRVCTVPCEWLRSSRSIDILLNDEVIGISVKR